VLVQTYTGPPVPVSRTPIEGAGRSGTRVKDTWFQRCNGAMPDTASFWAMDSEDYVEALRRAGADPSLSTHVLVHRLRMLGMRGGDRKLREAVRLYRTPVITREGWVTRAEAAAQLGLSIKRVDQLRREGNLVWETAGAGVLIELASVKRHQLQRAGLNPEPCGG
jgi:hypothetical protein